MELAKFLLFWFLLIIPSFLFSSVIIKEQLGLSSNFSYFFSDYDEKDFLGTGIFSFENEFYLGIFINHGIFEFGVAPSLTIKKGKHYLSFKNSFLNFYFDSLIVKLGKQNYHLGSGLIENIILDRIKDSEEWLAEIYYFVSNYIFSFGAILDEFSLDGLEKPKYLSPWTYFQLSFPKLDLLLMVETPFNLKNNNIDIKFIFDLSVEIYSGLFLYSTIRHDLLYDQDYVFRSEDNRYLLGSRYYIDFENGILNSIAFVFEGYLKSNNHFISTGFILTWIESLLKTSCFLKTNLNNNAWQIYFESTFDITKGFSLKIKSIFEPFGEKILFKNMPFNQILSIGMSFKV
ncbi:hypothetical protein [Borreliella japonica]|uniref:Uncharacterized protein n=1 Tax=Borreliella japonica TaxID=34095 RepID=A0A1G4Q939_BORJA|nr:hypothetical protein [Borreliella japonica]SCW41110.1 hypothetical protein SAMN02983004_00999 [Borreliella japonica]